MRTRTSSSSSETSQVECGHPELLVDVMSKSFQEIDDQGCAENCRDSTSTKTGTDDTDDDSHEKKESKKAPPDRGKARRQRGTKPGQQRRIRIW